MTEKISRTAAATAKRMQASEDKLATKLKGRGWFCLRAGSRMTPGPGMQLYATNGLRETYRVVGWIEGDRPVLQGVDDTFIGVQSYIFTVGPK